MTFGNFFLDKNNLVYSRCFVYFESFVYGSYTFVCRRFVYTRCNSFFSQTFSRSAHSSLNMQSYLSLLLTLGFVQATAVPSSTPFPPPLNEKICVSPGMNVRKDPILVKGFPASQKVIIPFMDMYKQPADLPRKDKICRPDGHCIMTHEIDVYETQARPFDNAVPECRNYSATWLLSYNGQVPGPTIRMPVVS